MLWEKKENEESYSHYTILGVIIKWNLVKRLTNRLADFGTGVPQKYYRFGYRPSQWSEYRNKVSQTIFLVPQCI